MALREPACGLTPRGLQVQLQPPQMRPRTGATAARLPTRPRAHPPPPPPQAAGAVRAEASCPEQRWPALAARSRANGNASGSAPASGSRATRRRRALTSTATLGGSQRGSIRRRLMAAAALAPWQALTLPLLPLPLGRLAMQRVAAVRLRRQRQRQPPLPAAPLHRRPWPRPSRPRLRRPPLPLRRARLLPWRASLEWPTQRAPFEAPPRWAPATHVTSDRQRPSPPPPRLRRRLGRPAPRPRRWQGLRQPRRWERTSLRQLCGGWGRAVGSWWQSHRTRFPTLRPRPRQLGRHPRAARLGHRGGCPPRATPETAAASPRSEPMGPGPVAAAPAAAPAASMHGTGRLAQAPPPAPSLRRPV
mmetsp:Transcript_3215/g.13186  ORF Transcript_3215/g.13186 Transcript_3215/m.13186 type:complete len:361 (-) Transcript_3215:781-1863(-)